MNNQVQAKSKTFLPFSKRGEESVPETAAGVSARDIAQPLPETEVSVKTSRRRFSVQYKLKILQETDAAEGTGQVGAILRREGLYSSNLTSWRRQREQGTLSDFSQQKRGRKRRVDAAWKKEKSRLEKENRRLQKKLDEAHQLIDLQKKMADFFSNQMGQETERNVDE